MDKQTVLEMYFHITLTRIERGAAAEEIDIPQMVLSSYALYALQPDWFHSDRFADGVEKLLSSLRKYCEKSPEKFKDYVQLTIENGLNNLANFNLEECDEGETQRSTHGIVNMGLLGILGLCYSEDLRDRQFVCNAMSRYIREVFPNSKRSYEAFQEERSRELKKWAASPLLAPGNPSNRNARNSLPMDKKLFIPSKTREMTPSEWVFHEVYWDLLRYAAIIIGDVPYFNGMPEDTRWQYMEQEDGSRVVDPSSAFARKAACLNPGVFACVYCSPEFQELLSTIYYVRSRGLPIEPLTKREDPEKDRYYKEARTLIVPFVEVARSFDHNYWRLNAGLIRAPGPTAEQKREQKKALAKLQGERDEAQRKSDSYAQELSKQKEETARVRKKLDTATLRLERAKAEADKQAAQTAELKATVKELSAAYDDLNEQFIASLEDQAEFLDDDDVSDLDAPSAQAGVRDRIGEEAYQKLAGKKLVIVGGHENTLAVLRNLFPDWRFYGIDGLMPDSLPSADAIVVLARYVSHSGYQKAKATAKTTGIPLVIANYNGPTSICRTLAAQII